MTGDVYAVVGVAGSDPAGLAFDLAGGFAAGGRETVLVELAPGSPNLLDALDLGLEFVFRSTVREVLSGSGDPVGAVTPVSVAHSAVESLGILPVDPGEDAPGTISLDGLAGTVAALREAYDVVVLAVESDGVDDVARLAGPTERALVVTTPDAEVARATSRLAARLGSAGLEVEGAVVTDCEEEADLWRAKSRLDGDVLAVLPPARPDRVDVVGDRIRSLRDELDGAEGSSPGEAPELDREPTVRSLLALVRGDATRATIATAAADDPDPADRAGVNTDTADQVEVNTSPDRSGEVQGETADPGESETGPTDPVDSEIGTADPGESEIETVDPEESRAGEDPVDEVAFEFGELPPAGEEGDGPGGDADGAPDDRDGSSGDLTDRISEILEGDENGDEDDGEGEGSGESVGTGSGG